MSNFLIIFLVGLSMYSASYAANPQNSLATDKRKHAFQQKSTRLYEQNAKQKSPIHINYVADPRLERILDSLIPSANALMEEQREVTWQIRVAMSNIPNAFSLAGGQIVLNIPFAWNQNFSDAELASLISHEMAHVIHEHSYEKYAVSKSIKGLFLGKLAVDLPFSRQLELEADVVGLEILSRAGYAPEAAFSFWQKATPMFERAEQKQNGGVLSTHPALDQRLALIQSHIPAMNDLQAQLGQKSQPQGAKQSSKTFSSAANPSL